MGATSSNRAMKAIAGLSLLLLAGCDKATEPGFAETPEASQHTVAYLKSLCDGRASVAVTQDVTCLLYTSDAADE